VRTRLTYVDLVAEIAVPSIRLIPNYESTASCQTPKNHSARCRRASYQSAISTRFQSPTLSEMMNAADGMFHGLFGVVQWERQGNGRETAGEGWQANSLLAPD
jgi:hypothetical protein